MADRLKWIQVWNRKLHIYIGLYLLFFIWLFAFSGLLLNHPQWEFAQFWPQRVETSVERTVQHPEAAGDLAGARELMAQLGIEGEVEQVTVSEDENRFEFQSVRPGHIVNVKAEFEAGRATVKTIETNGWGIVFMLHQFNGVRMEDAKQGRDWFMTTVWTVAMDAVCLGLIFWVLSGLYMWYQIKSKRRLGWMVLAAGLVCCLFFVFALDWVV